MRRLLLGALSAVVWTFLLLAPVSDAAADPDDEQWRGELPIRQPWLRDHLPDDALAYLRIPHPLGLLSTPKGNVLDPALRSESNVEMLRQIQQGIVDNVLPHIPAFADLRLRLGEQYLRSPIEVAMAMSPAPAVTISMNVTIDSNADFENVISMFGGGNPQFGLAAPLGTDGVGQLLGTASPVFLQFEERTGRLLLHGGPAVTAESFADTLAAADRDVPHRMAAMEARIDQSGQGFFMWLDAAQAMPMMQMFAAPEQADMLAELGLDKVRSVAYGWGVANGKGRLAIVAELPADTDRGALPYINVDLSARSVGSPDALIVFAIPSADEFERVVDVILTTAEPDAREEWLEAKLQFRKSLGVSISEVLNAVGPEFVAVFDEAGDYAAVRIRDRALWDRIIVRMSEKLGQSPDERTISGDTYYHVALPNEIARMDTSELGEAAWFVQLIGRMRDHVYWTPDRDYLYLASVPQVLIDRAAMRPRTDIGEWLAETQRIDADNAVLSISGTSQKLPRRLYMAYIEIMQLLADVAEAEVDIWSMPTARQLRLPAEGTVGFTINLGDPLLSAEFTFENNPFELLGGFGGVATAGILAAIAIPAYQDYTIRAQVSEGLSLSAGAKAAVVEHYVEFGQFPGLDAAGRLSIPADAGEYVWSVIVQPDTGAIYVEYRDDVADGGGQVVLEPIVESDGLIRWSCSGSFADKHLPAACRN